MRRSAGDAPRRPAAGADSAVACGYACSSRTAARPAALQRSRSRPNRRKSRQGLGSPSGKAGASVTRLPNRPTRQEKLSGFRSLKIDVNQTGMDQRQLLTFNSLGADPKIGITLACRNRNEVLVWGLALAVFVLGVALTTRPVRQKVALVLGLALASALLPLAWDTVSMARICNGVFYAASLLVPYYLAAGLVRWILQLAARASWAGWPAPAPAHNRAIASGLGHGALGHCPGPAAARGRLKTSAEREEYVGRWPCPAMRSSCPTT